MDTTNRFTYNDLIVVPTDFSEVCANAAAHAAGIAKQLNLTVCLVHIIDRNTRNWLKSNNFDEKVLDTKLTAQARQLAESYSIEVSTHLREGDIFSSLGTVLTDMKANLMVMATHGKTGFQRLMGSNALRVVTDSPVPVLVVQQRRFNDGYHRIVFPISNDMEVRQKVKLALGLQKRFGATLLLFQDHEEDSGLRGQLEVKTQQIMDELRRNGAQFRLSRSDEGDFAANVIQFSVAEEADLILVMSLADGETPGFFFNTWSEKIMFNTAQIPVMCLNPVDYGKIYFDL
jgi:nucleotide-binding universal stress UspA family protein